MVPEPGCPAGFRADGELLTLQEDGEVNGITLVYRTYREAAPEEGPSAGQTGDRGRDRDKGRDQGRAGSRRAGHPPDW